MMEALLEKERELQRLNAELDEKQRKMAAAATSPSPRKKVGDTRREPDTRRTATRTSADSRTPPDSFLSGVLSR